MAYSSVDATRIVAGKPVRADDILGLRNNQEDLNTRVTAVENLTSKVVVFNEQLRGLDNFVGVTSFSQVAVYRAASGFTLTGAKVTQFTAGSAGTLEIDVKVGSSLGSVSTIFSTKPSISYSVGNNSTSSNAVFSSQSVSANDWIILDITSIQTDQGDIHIEVTGEIL